MSCSSGTACIAVGDINGISGPVGPLAEQWNGTAWSIQANPQGQSLTGVSCTSATACTAVDPGAYRWNGSAWSIQPTPSEGNDGSFLQDVSCTAANSCTAVGYYRVYQQHFVYFFTLAEQWNGNAWSIHATPNPSKFQNRLGGVSCTTATACTAVGGIVSGPLAERWNGTAWSLQAIPNPAGATSISLSSVSCPTPTDCTAVGHYTNSSGAYAPLAERWNGTGWAIQLTPVPAEAIMRPGYSGACRSEELLIGVRPMHVALRRPLRYALTIASPMWPEDRNTGKPPPGTQTYGYARLDRSKLGLLYGPSNASVTEEQKHLDYIASHFYAETTFLGKTALGAGGDQNRFVVQTDWGGRKAFGSCYMQLPALIGAGNAGGASNLDVAEANANVAYSDASQALSVSHAMGATTALTGPRLLA